MAEYHAPVKDMLFTMTHLAGLNRINKLSGFEDATSDLVESVLEEAASLASQVIAPINEIGDREGTQVKNGAVVVPAEFTVAYQQFIEGGWSGISQPEEIGGQGLPYLVGQGVEEMWQSASLAWSLCPLLTAGAARAIVDHGDEAVRALFVEKMVAGEWTGTMNLTESQAGSDLSVIRSSAVPDGDGYRITGQKIFITWGDHEMTENVVHLVLARLAGAPEGVKGLSLFAVPKNLINADGSVGELNNVRPVSVEHKLGIHGSPTCVMSFEGSYGYLVGEENLGLACMFTMMNHARLGVGLEGVAISERAYQQALTYAQERVQGRKAGHQGSVPIIEHPDVRRMLMTMKSTIEAMRSLTYVVGAHLDEAHQGHDPDAQARLELLTPVVKGWCTEWSQLLTSMGVQIHGGMGFVEETGAAQHLRDARITTIYEGTTGIQANDLVGRKILRDKGKALTALIADMQSTVSDLQGQSDRLPVIAQALASSVNELELAAQWLVDHAGSDADVAGAVAFNFLMLMGTVTGGWQMARAAKIATELLDAGSEDRSFLEAKIISAQFYAEQMLPLAGTYRANVTAGADTIMALDAGQF
ncbi:MAG: acyl-CoA dehydrogenase C-terminal domain-containing protein [Gammaproteobacteria bacterium]|nr:acyl-CoA dehydrogenase C-terminal domain-containing protein [Gammaproteobacteria bacterium]